MIGSNPSTESFWISSLSKTCVPYLNMLPMGALGEGWNVPSYVLNMLPMGALGEGWTVPSYVFKGFLFPDQS
jgi:hypothetical protein